MAELAEVKASSELYYFAYGSNMNHEQISARCSKPKAIAVAKLSDYRLAFFGYSVTWDGGEETVVPAPGNAVWGVVYQLSGSDKEKLDDAQDARMDGSGSYFHSPASVTGQDGTVYPILLFKKDNLGTPAQPSQEYLSFIVQGAEKHQLPAAYVKTLQALESRKAKYAVPRPRKTIRELAPDSGCSSCGDAPAPSNVISISLGSGGKS
jgi:hypothetical protein